MPLEIIIIKLIIESSPVHSPQSRFHTVLASQYIQELHIYHATTSTSDLGKKHTSRNPKVISLIEKTLE